MQSCKQALVRHRREAGELKVKMQRLEDDAEALRDALDKENVEDGLLDTLRTALQEAEDDKQINEGSYNDSITAMENMVQVLKEIRREKSVMDKKIDELLERSRVAGSEQSLVENKRRELINEKNMAVADIAKEKSDRARLDDKLQQAQARVLSNAEQATMVSERVALDEGETAASLDQKISKLTRDLIRYSKE